MPSENTFTCATCKGVVTVALMPDQPPDPDPEAPCLLAVMIADGRWAISEMLPLNRVCYDVTP